MSKESEGASTAPEKSSGDGADRSSVAKNAQPAKKGTAKTSAPSAQTDKGSLRPGTTDVAKGDSNSTTDKPASDKAVADKKPTFRPTGGPAGRPLTAADYARTTKGSSTSTSVIPAIKDKLPKPKSTAASFSESAPSASAGRRASLRLTHVEPWSVTRLAFVISVAMMIVAVVAATIFWVVLDFVGVWQQINDSLTSVLSDDTSSFDVKDYFGFGRFVGLTLVLSMLNVVIMTVLATIGAHLYNLATQLMGGVEVTFTEQQ